jgi:hypothetical protein
MRSDLDRVDLFLPKPAPVERGMLTGVLNGIRDPLIDQRVQGGSIHRLDGRGMVAFSTHGTGIYRGSFIGLLESAPFWPRTFVVVRNFS